MSNINNNINSKVINKQMYITNGYKKNINPVTITAHVFIVNNWN